MEIGGGAMWPQVNGAGGKQVDAQTQADPVTGIQLCKDCWNGKHPRLGCLVYECKCGCYKGKNKGLGKPRAPHATCKENQELPDVGTITV